MQPPKSRVALRALTAIAIATAAASMLAGCPGAPPPPEDDLSSAAAKTADTADMFTFALEAWIETRTPSGEVSRSTTRHEGSARNNEGYRTNVWTSPGPPGASTPLVVDEFPGAVRAPGTPYWFSGKSGSMDAFGPLAEVLPPLGSAKSVIGRFDSIVISASKVNEIEDQGTREIRGHNSDCYGLPIVAGTLPSPTRSPAPPGAATSTKTSTPAMTPTAAPVAPSPKAVEEAARALLATVAGTPSQPAEGAPGRISVGSTACVDQLDGRLRRVQADIDASMYGASISARATIDIWGYDPSGNFNEPIDTVLLGPAEQDRIRTSAYPIVGPSRLPEGLQFVSLVPITGWIPCPAMNLAFTGRGRDGYVDVHQASAGCATGGVERTGISSVTETASGERVEYGEVQGELVANRDVGRTFAQLRAKEGISKHETISMAASLRPIDIPIPPSLTLPLPSGGPERR